MGAVIQDLDILRQMVWQQRREHSRRVPECPKSMDKKEGIIMSEKRKVPGTGGDHYIPYEERAGGESVVFFTRDLSAKGLVKIYECIGEVLGGKVAVKLHTGEKNGPNFFQYLLYHKIALLLHKL